MPGFVIQLKFKSYELHGSLQDGDVTASFSAPKVEDHSRNYFARWNELQQRTNS